MNDIKIELVTLTDADKETFITEIQAAFKKAVVEEFGDNGTEAIPREDVINAFNDTGAESYNIVCNGEIIGGTVLKICPDTRINELVLFFIKVDCHSKGVGTAAWRAIENLHPETKIWQTATPYFEKRNINFYVNKCGFSIVEFFNPHHPNPRIVNTENFPPGVDFLFRFEKDMTAKR